MFLYITLPVCSLSDGRPAVRFHVVCPWAPLAAEEECVVAVPVTIFDVAAGFAPPLHRNELINTICAIFESPRRVGALKTLEEGAGYVEGVVSGRYFTVGVDAENVVVHLCEGRRGECHLYQREAMSYRWAPLVDPRF